MPLTSTRAWRRPRGSSGFGTMPTRPSLPVAPAPAALVLSILDQRGVVLGRAALEEVVVLAEDVALEVVRLAVRVHGGLVDVALVEEVRARVLPGALRDVGQAAGLVAGEAHHLAHRR